MTNITKLYPASWATKRPLPFWAVVKRKTEPFIFSGHLPYLEDWREVNDRAITIDLTGLCVFEFNPECLRMGITE